MLQSLLSKRYSFWLGAIALTTAGTIYFANRFALPSSAKPIVQPVAVQPEKVAPTPDVQKEPEIFDTLQVAILLDTSSSMDGLINQARSQLWSMVNELGQGRKVVDGKVHGVKLEIGVYEYGNDRIARQSNYIRQVLPFSKDLDKVSEALYSLRTDGGSEFAGAAITRAIDELQWSDNQDVLKFVFVAGNEDFNQGPIQASEAMASASKKNIAVQLIHCGSEDASWDAAAKFAHSDLVNINQNEVVNHIAAPQDDEIARISSQINGTYMAYGKDGEVALERQRAQDKNAELSGKASVVARAAVKAKKSYKAESWDFLDAAEAKPELIANAKDEELPAELRGKSVEERTAIVAQKRAERELLVAKLAKLNAERDAHVKRIQAEAPPAAAAQSFDAKATGAVKKAAAAKGYQYK